MQLTEDVALSLQTQIFRNNCILSARDIPGGDELCIYCQDASNAIQKVDYLCAAHAKIICVSVKEFMNKGEVELTELKNRIVEFVDSVATKRRRKH